MTSLLRSLTLTTAATLALAVPAIAEPVEDDQLIVNGEIELATEAPAPEHLKGVKDTIYSGWRFRDTETRAMQKDDFDNPMFLNVEAGRELWTTKMGTADQSCADCHNDISSMKGLRAVMPRVTKDGELWSMESHITDCLTNRMGVAEPWGWNSPEMKNMTAAISVESRGMPVAVAIDGAAAPFWEKGKAMYYTRFGQLEMSCANCHEDNAGNYIRSDHLSQGQTNGFPLYRLKDQGPVSIHQRFVGCVRDTRAETFKAGSQEFRELELYVASRGIGLPVEGVAVRH